MTAAASVRERPILMSGPMVRATIEDRKTQTRRVVLPQPTSPAVLHDVSAELERFVGGPLEDRRPYCVWMSDRQREDGKGFAEQGVRCPYGAVGDRLWVRETFYLDDYEYQRGALPSAWPDRVSRDALYYRADGECCEQIPECACAEIGKPPWRPSIHMPRWACRLVIELTDVRVERVQAITADDALAEGVTCPQDASKCGLPKLHFADLWELLNGKRGYGWDVNPWVWVLSFRRVEP